MPPAGESAGARDLAQILVVEGDERFRELLAELLRGAGYDCVTSDDAEEARSLIASQAFAAVISDAQLPGGEGTELLKLAARGASGHRPRDAERLGRPRADRPRRRARGGRLHHEAVRAQRGAGRGGQRPAPARPRGREPRVPGPPGHPPGRTGRPSSSRPSRGSSSPRTRSRSRTSRRSCASRRPWSTTTARPRATSSGWAGTPSCSPGLRTLLRRWFASRASCTTSGRSRSEPNILQKQGQLTSTERQGMERHCEIGYQLLGGSDSELLELAATIALTHHERFDGTGYPQGLGGEDIPIEGRIVAVADVFDALTSDRAYRPAYPVEEALVDPARRPRHAVRPAGSRPLPQLPRRGPGHPGRAGRLTASGHGFFTYEEGLNLSRPGADIARRWFFPAHSSWPSQASRSLLMSFVVVQRQRTVSESAAAPEPVTATPDPGPAAKPPKSQPAPKPEAKSPARPDRRPDAKTKSPSRPTPAPAPARQARAGPGRGGGARRRLPRPRPGQGDRAALHLRGAADDSATRSALRSSRPAPARARSPSSRTASATSGATRDSSAGWASPRCRRS